MAKGAEVEPFEEPFEPPPVIGEAIIEASNEVVVMKTLKIVKGDTSRHNYTGG